jgi:cytochrome c oxidase cbb3-type subunit I/II
VVAIGSLAEAIPMFLIKSNVASIEDGQPYTPLELAGRDIYVSEGCYNCHSQMIRPMLAETERYGEYSKPWRLPLSVYDRPVPVGQPADRPGPRRVRAG